MDFPATGLTGTDMPEGESHRQAIRLVCRGSKTSNGSAAPGPGRHGVLPASGAAGSSPQTLGDSLS